jgi:hypothetical protein
MQVPYFIDLDQHQIVVLPPGRLGGPELVPVDTDLATELALSHGQGLTNDQITALREANATKFRFASSAPGTPSATTSPATTSPAATDPRSEITRRAFAVANVVEAAGWILLVLSVIAGWIIATSTRTNPFDGSTDHPYVGAGLATIVVGAVQALMIVMVATYIKSRTERPAS